MGFIFGGNTGIRTPEEAKRLREVAEALAVQRRAPQNIGEGLSAIGDAIASRRYRLRGERMEKEGRAAFQEKYGDYFKTLFSGGGGAADPVPTAPGGVVPPAPDLSQAHPEYLTGGGMPPPPTMENVANTQLPPAEDLAAMVRTVIGEAGNQSPEAQRAVAEVILNRSRQTGQTPQQIVSAPGQFEPWATRGAELNAIDPNSQQYQSVLGNITPAFAPDDPTGGADHFYAPQAQAALGRDTPDWAQGQQGRDIGDHRFYSLGYGGAPDASGAQQAVTEQGAGQPGMQLAGGGGFDPRMIEALSDPWIPEGQRAVLEELFKQRLKQMEPTDYGFTEVNGDIIRTDPRKGTVETVLDNPDKPADPFTLSEGQVRYGPNGQEIARGPEKEPDLPSEAKMFLWAQANGFKGSIEDWQRLKGTNVQIGSKTLDAEYAKDFHDLLVQGRDAQSTLGSLDVMEQAMNDPGFYSGAGGETVLQLKRFGAALGMNPEGISSMETFQSQAKQLALSAMGGSLGSGFSNADRDFVTGQVAGLENTPAGNKKLIAITREITKRRIQVAELAGQYADMPEHGGQIDRGFDAYLRQWAEANPLFPPQQQADPNDPVGTEYDSIDAIPEGAIVEDNGVTKKKVNGQLVPVQ